MKHQLFLQQLADQLDDVTSNFLPKTITMRVVVGDKTYDAYVVTASIDDEAEDHASILIHADESTEHETLPGTAQYAHELMVLEYTPTHHHGLTMRIVPLSLPTTLWDIACRANNCQWTEADVLNYLANKED